MKHRFEIKIGDVLLVAAILILTVLLFLLPLFKESAEQAEIVIADSGEVKKISLLKNETYDIESRGVSLTVAVLDGEVFVSESDCKDGFCKSTPPISRAGQSIVCAPAGVVVRIVGEGAEVDAVS